jgi:ribonuclease Z
MNKTNVTRRDFLKLQAAALGGLALAGSTTLHAAASATCSAAGDCLPDDPTQKNTLYDHLETCCPGEPLADDEMRISFLGTSCIPRLSQQGVSVYVEVGPTYYDEQFQVLRPTDYAMFDCGMGVLANYIAMDIPYSRMDKIFLAHLHGDHMSELSAIYCFGEASDRKSPLFVWGPSKSGVPDPKNGRIYDDGITNTMKHFREVWRWHTESFSFASNGYEAYVDPTGDWGLPVVAKPVRGTSADPRNDSYALVPIQLPWRKIGGVAYDNRKTGLKITHFPAIHCRKGSLSYKVEWTPPNHPEQTLSMIYSGDTRPTYTMIDQAAGVDVLVHEIVMPPEVWTRKIGRIPDDVEVPPGMLAYGTDVVNSSHTTQGAFGYLLSQVQPAPRLAICTHFQAADDTIASATATIDKYLGKKYDDPAAYPPYTFAADFMVVNVQKEREIRVRRADVSRFAYSAPSSTNPLPHSVPKYHKRDAAGNLVGDPYAQINVRDWVPFGEDTYDEDGF